MWGFPFATGARRHDLSPYEVAARRRRRDLEDDAFNKYWEEARGDTKRYAAIQRARAYNAIRNHIHNQKDRNQE